jgi:outer membrane receptor protein involved in Fe transport
MARWEKMMSKASIYLLAGPLSVALAVGTAQAQDAAPQAQASPQADSGFGDIIVTAQKREQSLSKVGLTIAAVGADTLTERAIMSPADIAQAVPGLSYTNSANNTPVYTLRGVGFYDTSLGSYPTASVYVDQVPLPFPILTSLTAFDLERVEVVKGPQGTLFGQNSTGGAINYIAAKPTSEFSAGGDASYSRFNTFTGNAYVSGPLGDTLRARIAVRGSRGGPWQKSYTRDDENGRTRELAGRFLLDWTPSDRFKLELNINGWRDKSDPQAVQYLAFNEQAISNTQPVRDYPLSPRNPRAADWSTDNGMFMDRKLGQASVRADWEFVPDITLTSITSYIAFKETGAMDQDGMNLQDIDLRNFYGRIRSFSQELRLANDQASSFRWIIGGNYSRDKVYYRENLVYDDSSAFYNYGINTSENYSDQKMTNIAGFGNAELDIGDAFTLKAGLRYTKNKRSADICNHDGGNGLTAAFFSAAFGLNPPLGINDCFALDNNFQTGEFHGNLNEDNLSWRAGVDWKASDTLLLYANVSKGFKAGGFGNINASAQVQYAPAVQESILNYEAGFKLQAANRRVSLNGAVFYMDYKDKQLRSKLIDGTFGVLDAIINIPKSRLQGAEIELQARPVQGLSFGFAMTYIDSKIKDYVGVNAGGVTADFAGSTVPFTPKWQGSANMRFDIPLTDSINLFGGPQLTYRSGTYAIVGETPEYRIDEYVLLDAQLGIESADDRWKVMLWGKNITSEYYWTNVVAGQDTIVRYAARPATYGVTVGFKY